jgi:hypothetical protein
VLASVLPACLHAPSGKMYDRKHIRIHYSGMGSVRLLTKVAQVATVRLTATGRSSTRPSVPVYCIRKKASPANE